MSRFRDAAKYRREREKLPKLSEADIERYGTELLQLDGWRALKTDPVSDRSRGKGFGEVGMADYLYIRYAADNPYRRVAGGYRGDQPDFKPRGWAEVLWIEWKRPRGRVADHQRAWHQAERARGALVWVATEDFDPTPEAFKARYELSGLMRRRIT